MNEHDRDLGILAPLSRLLDNEHYLRVDGKPLLVVYRPERFDDSTRTADQLRAATAALGHGEPYLAMVQNRTTWDPRGYGFDAAIELPPRSMTTTMLGPVRHHEAWAQSAGVAWGPDHAQSYEQAVEWSMSKPVPDFPWFRGLMAGWDSTPCEGDQGTVFLGDSVESFERWLERVLHFTYLFHPPGRRLVFVNAWNDWSHGAYLEPDVERGTAMLEAVDRTLTLTRTLAERSAIARTDCDPVLALAQAYFRAHAVLAREVFVEAFQR